MRWTVVLSILSFLSAGPVQVSAMQKAGLALPDPVLASKYRDLVKDIFRTSYAAYKQYAWGHDNLASKSRSYSDARNGWGASIIDAMSTMYVMDLGDLLNDAIAYVGTVNFRSSKTLDHVRYIVGFYSIFETTIRYLGGILSVYELRGSKDKVLLKQAVDLGDKMAYPWVGDNNLPFGTIDFTSDKPDVDTASTNIAEAGTLLMEWATLSAYTGNDTYRKLADKAIRHIAGQDAPFPGLAAQIIDRPSGKFVGGYVGGGSDSYLEYLLNIYYRVPLLAIIFTLVIMMRHRRHFTTSAHIWLCFHAGNWLYGGTILQNQTIVNTALELLDGCWNTYASTETGIGPEAFAYITPEQSDRSLSSNQRPEVLESNFYAWRITGDSKYLDRVAKAVDNFQKYLRTDVAYDGIYNVDDQTPTMVNNMESFWFAEVLKYLYLTFDDPTNMSIDDYVFNTEAHPFRKFKSEWTLVGPPITL
ncbi:glycoside hydrolase family 47 protein [Desarmillaria tabescens]|uniref:alpha-1,2-Mannosidase n=1 Tax=Armillaria tabescens TaxID=1929756 RepID=A0AA39JIH8_ARMTA|nr:glycoside hydrolase family 47 protein [Desarmillaria tabescens]KAK0443054.1 glycoside hydrolase family 47 protein [Desarmillaria tabescens]